MSNWITTIIALIMAWNCNVHEPLWVRILVLLIAFLYSEIYVSYYILYHWILKNPCANSIGSVSYLV